MVRGDTFAREDSDGDITVSEQDARGAMGRIGLQGQKALRRIADLSGGEKARVALAMILLKASSDAGYIWCNRSKGPCTIFFHLCEQTRAMEDSTSSLFCHAARNSCSSTTNSRRVSTKSFQPLEWRIGQT
jgi:hypothetical protein